jgi:tetratricopeptide (TPR) repeat protein
MYIPLVPLLAVFMGRLIQGGWLWQLSGLTLFCLAGIYVWVVSGNYYKQLYKRQSFGLYISAAANPVGAAQFIKQQLPSHTRFFSDYLCSSYLMYAVPGFKTYCDLRDQDVFPDTFIANAIRQANIPEEFHKADSLYHFDGVVLLRHQFKGLHSYLYNNTNFKPVFIDDNCVVYLKNARQPLVCCYTPDVQNALGHLFTFLLNPVFHLKDNADDMTPAEEYFGDVGDTRAQANYLAARRTSNITPAYLIALYSGELAFDSAQTTTDSLSRYALLRRSHEYLMRALVLRANNVQTGIDLCQWYQQTHKYDSAIIYAQMAYHADPYDPFAISTLASAYVSAGNARFNTDENFGEAIHLYKIFLHYSPDDVSTLFNIGALYAQLHDDRGRGYLQQALDSHMLNAEQEQTAQSLLNNL